MSEPLFSGCVAKWRLMVDWPSNYIPVGAVFEAPTNINGDLIGPPTWKGQPLPVPLPFECMALDDDAATAMSRWYPGFEDRLRFAPGVRARPLPEGPTEEQWRAYRAEMERRAKIMEAAAAARAKQSGKV
jgi:hypothetical protein